MKNSKRYKKNARQPEKEIEESYDQNVLVPSTLEVIGDDAERHSGILVVPETGKRGKSSNDRGVILYESETRVSRRRRQAREEEYSDSSEEEYDSHGSHKRRKPEPKRKNQPTGYNPVLCIYKDELASDDFEKMKQVVDTSIRDTDKHRDDILIECQHQFNQLKHSYLFLKKKLEEDYATNANKPIDLYAENSRQWVCPSCCCCFKGLFSNALSCGWYTFLFLLFALAVAFMQLLLRSLFLK